MKTVPARQGYWSLYSSKLANILHLRTLF